MSTKVYTRLLIPCLSVYTSVTYVVERLHVHSVLVYIAQVRPFHVPMPLSVTFTDRLRDEEERKESSSSRQRESCRSPRARGDEPGGGVMDGLTLDDELQQGVDDGKIDGNTPHRGTATSLHYRRPAVSPRCARDNSDVSGCGGGHSAPGELELPHRHSQAEHEILMNGFGIMNKFGKIDDKDLECMGDDDDGNFEDEFDPILASIRKPPQPSPTASCASSSTVGGGSKNSSSPGKGGISEGGDRGKRHDSGVSFGTGLRSIFPRNVRARAEDVVTQSSANMSKTAGAFRVAFGLGVNGTGGTGWRRDSSTGMVREEGREKDLGTISSARRVGLGGGKCSGLGGEEDVLVLDANELLSEEEVISGTAVGSVGTR